MRTFGIAGLLAMGISLALAQNPTASVDTSVDASGTSSATLASAKALARQGHLEKALAELDGLSKAEPEAAEVERLRGIILYQKELLPDAATAFARAVAQDATDQEAKEMLGITLYRLGRPQDAIPFLESSNGEQKIASASEGGESLVASPVASPAINTDPKYVLGLCYTDTGRYDDARRAFAAQFGFGADSAEAYLVAARLFLRREFVEEAAIFAQKAIELNPSLPLAHQLLGEVALAKADLPLAIKELEAEHKLNPLNGAMYDRLGDAYVRNSQFEEARQALNKAILLEPNTTGPYILLGEALIKLGEPIQAVHYLNRAVTMDPDNYVTHTFLGQAYRALGQVADANREYKLAIDIQHKGDSKPEQPK
ncbi:tetratricopeptide repeat protein [Acidicapsa ligni]|uniref:tetratricopeptide repeat protein n=1 Tax=Acidicapsa ligni TaxID=542300 RepID=UPI0021E01EF1|nr:tetratricopeptide repeat protein [Acidicapsa ligni]